MLTTSLLNNFNYRVYYEDTDCGGVVYYANYLKFFERARTDFLRLLGISQSELVTKENLIFVVKRCEIDYIFSAKLDDVLEVKINIKKISAASIVIHQEMFVSNSVCCKLEVQIVCVNSLNFKPKKIPQNIKTLLHVR